MQFQRFAFYASFVTSMLIAGTDSVLAVEGDNIIYPAGVENYFGGLLPPPGTYYLNNLNLYTASRVNNGDGKSVVPDFHVQVVADAQRFVHAWGDFSILGARVGSQVIVPILNINVHAGGMHQTNFGIGNVTVTPLVLSWDFDNWHFVAANDINLPLGSYKKGNPANLIQNYFQFEPVGAITYRQEMGPEFFIKMMYDFNTSNPTTHYHSGQTFHFDYGAGWNLGAWEFGAVGYYLTQTTDDTHFGSIVGPDGNRAQAYAIGPGVHYMMPDGIQLWANWQHELIADNHSQGDSFWLKAAIPL